LIAFAANTEQKKIAKKAAKAMTSKAVLAG
jgi:hypothetical protein